MSLTLNTGGDFETLAKGQYKGTCYRIVDLGTTEQEYEGVKSKKKRLHITFEITAATDPATNDSKMQDGRPFAVSHTYTASLFESATLRKHLVSWRGKNFTEAEEAGFDVTKLLGCTANVEVGHTKNGNAKIIGLFKPDGGIEKIATVNEQIMFDLDVYCDEFNGKTNDSTKAMCDTFDSLTVWQQNDIESSFELIAAKNTGTSQEERAVKEDVQEQEGLSDLASNDADDDANIEAKIPF
tara:strand:- start:898 stop:1617 length:720 start_codon:yes stop_codon:yes gene_type:complete